MSVNKSTSILSRKQKDEYCNNEGRESKFKTYDISLRSTANIESLTCGDSSPSLQLNSGKKIDSNKITAIHELLEVKPIPETEEEDNSAEKND